ncbi:MAG TPA: TauD/TfdA family dioxygenase [Stellaceae bacterium]|jgi:alpha-ketoglutarate-dependent 2,4-dichlorophenoxyacetate dioxygenase|nr:TauD/TfdA family dioxygenase [Stellaceae bacterium]
MSIAIRQLHPLFVGEISGIDISRPLDAATVQALNKAIDRYAVLVFHDQTLDDERQMAFARQFGELEIPRSGNADVKRRLRPEIADISNLDADNQRRGRDDPRRFDQLGNRLWHTDGSFRRVPAALSMLYAHRVPKPGPLGKGETEFADMRAAYDALPDATKAEIDDLVALHDIAWSRGQLGFNELLFGERQVLPPVPQRLVRRHPGSGRKTLYVAAHASEIVGWPLPDGRLLLSELIEHATRREFVYRHAWREGDLVIWDNRCTMHRGRAFDENEIRDLRRATTRDVASTLDQVA